MSEQPKRIAVHLFGWGRTSHEKGDFVVDRAFYKKMRDSFDYITKRKHPPVLRQHEEDGFGWGKVEEITTAEEGTELEVENDLDKPGMWAVVQLSAPAYKAWTDGNIVDWSPSFAAEFRDRHTGKKLENFLRELSFVSVGHLYNTDTPSPAYALSDSGFIENQDHQEQDMEDKKKKENEDNGAESVIETLSGQIGALVEQIEAMPARVAEAVADEMKVDAEDYTEEPTETAGDEQEMSDDPDPKQQALASEVAELRSKLEEQQTERTKESARAEIAENGIDLSDAERSDLIQLACDAPEAFSSMITVLKTKQDKIVELSDQPNTKNGGAYRLSGEVGSVGQAETNADGMSGLRKLCDKLDVEGDSPSEKRKNARRALQEQGAVNWGDAESAAAGRKVLDEKFPA